MSDLLKNITLCCIDCKSLDRAMRALMYSSRNLKFNQIKLFTNNLFEHKDIQCILINEIQTKYEYSNFILKKLNNYINTDFIIIVQWDGFIINHKAWKDEFLNYDYIGAPWPQLKHLIGNGGFSLRSKKLLELTQRMDLKASNPQSTSSNEDVLICQTYRKELEDAGIKFAPYEVAKHFSVENEEYIGQLGWHGGSSPQNFFDWYLKKGS